MCHSSQTLEAVGGAIFYQRVAISHDETKTRVNRAFRRKAL
jgi:hypothetical protein